MHFGGKSAFCMLDYQVVMFSVSYLVRYRLAMFFGALLRGYFSGSYLSGSEEKTTRNKHSISIHK